MTTLYVQVLIGIALGVLVGAPWPEVGVALKPLGDAFIKLVKLVIAPVIFLTVASGVTGAGFITLAATLAVVPASRSSPWPPWWWRAGRRAGSRPIVAGIDPGIQRHAP